MGNGRTRAGAGEGDAVAGMLGDASGAMATSTSPAGGGGGGGGPARTEPPAIAMAGPVVRTPGLSGDSMHGAMMEIMCRSKADWIHQQLLSACTYKQTLLMTSCQDSAGAHALENSRRPASPTTSQHQQHQAVALRYEHWISSRRTVGSQLAERARAVAPVVLVAAMPLPQVAVDPSGLKVAVCPGPQLANACVRTVTAWQHRIALCNLFPQLAQDSCASRLNPLASSRRRPCFHTLILILQQRASSTSRRQG